MALFNWKEGPATGREQVFCPPDGRFGVVNINLGRLI